MDHVAIMNPSWRLIPKIVSGEKTIESRWYQTRRAPWGILHPEDKVYFKNAGAPVTACATVSKVLQFAFKDPSEISFVVEQYGTQICLVNPDPATWGKVPKYAILAFLADPQWIADPFHIDKAGFGAGAAWLAIPDIERIRIRPRAPGKGFRFDLSDQA